MNTEQLREVIAQELATWTGDHRVAVKVALNEVMKRCEALSQPEQQQDGKPEVVAWLVQPNEKSHQGLEKQLCFHRPVMRADWEAIPLYRLDATDQKEQPPASAPAMTDEQILQWAERHDLKQTLSDLHAIASDIRSVHLLSSNEQPSVNAEVRIDKFYLASYKGGRSIGFVTWWKPDNAGYTPYLEQAGIYTLEQIQENPSYYDNDYTIPVPVDFIKGHESMLIDMGHSRNTAFWNAKSLRAAIRSLSNEPVKKEQL